MRGHAAIFVVAIALIAAPTAAPSTASQLHARAHRQHLTLHKDHGTLRFFRNHPRLAATPAGVRALRFARAELAWTGRELARTRDYLTARTGPPTPWTRSWLNAAMCVHGHESRDWHNRGYFRGGMQFLASTWQSVGGRGDPADASPSEQLYRAWLLWKQQGWHPWPTTARACGLL